MGKKLKRLRENIDRISNFSDDILTCILSFLSTKDAVKTSVLSKRWTPLWVCVPTLNLSDLDFLPRGSRSKDIKRRQPIFLAFMYEYLLQANFSRITRFHLDCSGTYDEPLVRSWVYFAKKNNVQELSVKAFFYETSRKKRNIFVRFYRAPDSKNSSYTGALNLETTTEFILDTWMRVVAEWNTIELDLGVTYMKMQKLPSSFPYDILVALRLSSVLINFPLASVCFPKLKVLSLLRVEFDSGHLTSDGINSYNCPVLEELEMCICDMGDVQSLTITSETLRRLSLTDGGGGNELHTIVDAPNIQYLSLLEGVVGEYVSKNLGFLVEASLKCSIGNECLCLLLRKINNVKDLHLSNMAMKWLSDVSFDFPIFPNLTCLEFNYPLRTRRSIRWDVIEALLRNSPMLKEFSTHDINLISFEKDYKSTLTYDVPSCLVSKLEKIHLCEIGADGMNLRIVEYFLKNSKVLKEMSFKIGLHEDSSVEQIRKEILEFPKAQSACLIEFPS